jgi:hypothetical protein
MLDFDLKEADFMFLQGTATTEVGMKSKQNRVRIKTGCSQGNLDRMFEITAKPRREGISGVSNEFRNSEN